MKLKALILALFVAGVASSFALAGPPEGKGKGDASSTGATTQAAAPACKPNVSFILKGTVETVAADSFTMQAAKGNSHFRKLKLANPVNVLVDAKTKFNGHRKLADLKAGNRVNVQVRGCKKADPATFVLLAKRVAVQGTADVAPATTEATTVATSS
jgi:hypothetical protein